MKTTKVLTIVFLSLIACTTSVYAQINVNTSNKSTSTSSKVKPVVGTKKKSSSASTNTVQKKPVDPPANVNSTSSATERKKNTNRTNQGNSNTLSTTRKPSPEIGGRPTSSNTVLSTGNGRRVPGSSTSSRNSWPTSTKRDTGSDVSDSRSGANRAGGSLNRNQTGNSDSNTGNVHRKPQRANINHSRERMIQRKRALSTRTTSGSAPTAGNWNTTTSTTPMAKKAKSTNFVYSPYSNSVKKMRPSSGVTHTSPRPITRPGLWSQCERSQSASRTTRLSQVQAYAKLHLNMNVIDYGFSSGVLYVISEDSAGVFLQACNEGGKVLDEQAISREYSELTTNEENSGCWIMKPGDKDPQYYSFDGEHLLRYTPDGNVEIIDLNFCEALIYTISKDNQHTYLQIYSNIDENPIASTEIDDDFNTIDVEAASCGCYIKDAEDKQSLQALLVDEEIIMFDVE